jgi:hypothetical protein
MEGSEAQEASAQLEGAQAQATVPNMLEAPPEELTLMDGEEEEEDTNENQEASEPEDEYDPDSVLELGDRVIIDSKKYGRTVGTIYYRSGDLIRIMPDGAQNILYDFERIFTDDEDRFADELGVTDTFILEKRKYNSFVELNDIRVGQTIESITKSGEPGPLYLVETVNPEDDEIIVKNKDTGETETLSFGYIGIDTDLPFVILRKAILTPAEAEQAEKERQEAEERGDAPEEGEEGVPPEDEADETLDVPEFIAVPAGKIVLPKPTIYREAKAADKVYTDTDQKIDALTDFISMLDPLAQKDQKEIRNQRILVETMFQMKQALTALNPDGSVKGPEPVSVDTIAQLLDKVDVPLGRAVLDITKRIYKRPGEDNEEDDSESPEDYYTVSFANELEQMSTADTTEMPGAAPTANIKKFWFNQQAFADNYARPWRHNSVVPPTMVPKSDVEIFRRYVPDINEEQIPGGFEITDPYNGKLDENYPMMTNIKISTARALGPTYRKGDDKRKQVVIAAEAASLKSYLLFPMETSHLIGTNRSGSLAIDSGRSQQPLTTLIDLFTELGGVQDVPTSKSIIALDVAGKTIGNIPLKDYIEGLNIRGTGLGDARKSLVELGLDQLELTPEILAVIESKLKAYQDQLITTIATLREELKDISGNEMEPVVDTSYLLPNPILDGPIRTQPILVEDLVTFEKQNPVISKSDIAQFVYLLRKHADYFQTAAGQQTVFTAREKLRATRDIFLDSLEISERLREKREDRGEKPEPNLCPHVAQLRTIRKIRDENERYSVLTKFLVKYQGNREENWIMCNTCNKELLCVHERNQIQAFLSPKEKDQLQKELFINFSDGVFQGHFICRNCGQPMQELGYDTHMEYDDEGRPMSGRAVLEDTDELKRAEIDAVLGLPIEPSEEEILFTSPAEKSYYIVIKEISTRIGVNLNEVSFRRIVSNVDKHMKRLKTRQAYTKDVKKGLTKVDYDVMVAQNLICASALFVLVEVQTRIPDFVVRYSLPGCVASFSGFPLGAEQDIRGLTYLACAVSTIKRDEAPWNISGFTSVKSEEKVRTAVLNRMGSILEAALKEDLTLHQLIQEKRAYIKRMLGTDVTHDTPKDEIPFGFLPEQLIVKPTDEPIIPEVAANINTTWAQLAVAKAWILQGHHLANKTANLVKGSPYIETTCCLTNIQAPGSFWDSASNMPKLPIRQIQPILLLQSILKVHFDPRKQEILLAETPEDILFRLFLKVCFQGPRKGLPHEPGLTHLCPWCGFQFPGHPKYIDMEKEGQSALVSQEVKTGKDEFQALLDDVHKENNVPKFEETPLSSTEKVMKELAEMEPAPMEGWTEIIESTLTGLKELAPDANRGDVLTAIGQLSDRIREARSSIESRLTARTIQFINQVDELSWTNFFQFLQAYIIVPFQRIINGMGYGTKIIPRELDLSEDHEKMIKEKIFMPDDKIVVQFMSELQKPTNAFGVAKLRKYLTQMSKIMEFKSKIRAIMVKGRASTLNYFQRAFFYGPLETLFNPHDIPDEYAETAAELGAGDASADTSIKALLYLVSVSIGKAMSERLTFNDEELKNLIAARDEKERKKVVSDFDTMSEDERQVEMVHKFLGLGRFAAGGTKVIYAYDKEWFDHEAKMRKDAGIIDFQDSTPTEFLGFPQDGPALDAYGFPVTGADDDRYMADNGYDNRQFGEDD